MGNTLLQSGRFNNIYYLIPLPLFADKERKRGYNQATVICNGLAAAMQIPVLTGNVVRSHFTETQTRKHRIERWENVDGSFVINNPAVLKGKSVLLVDDVITTGATLEACGNLITQAEDVKLYIATLAHAGK
jgi:ComF family protein